jgi:hypothetical protein
MGALPLLAAARPRHVALLLWTAVMAIIPLLVVVVAFPVASIARLLGRARSGDSARNGMLPRHLARAYHLNNLQWVCLLDACRTHRIVAADWSAISRNKATA